MPSVNVLAPLFLPRRSPKALYIRPVLLFCAKSVPLCGSVRRYLSVPYTWVLPASIVACRALQKALSCVKDFIHLIVLIKRVIN